MTPPEVARVGAGAPDTPGWQVRVVPNLYPIVGDGVAGAHEVIVLSPAHDGQLDRLPPDAATAAVIALRDRAAHHLDSRARARATHAQPGPRVGCVDRASTRAAGRARFHPAACGIAAAPLRDGRQRPRRRCLRSGPRRIVPSLPTIRRHLVPTRVEHAVRHADRAARTRRQRFDLATDTEISVLTGALQDALDATAHAARRGRVQRRRAHGAPRRPPAVSLVGRHRAARLASTAASSSGPVCGSTRERRSPRPRCCVTLKP